MNKNLNQQGFIGKFIFIVIVLGFVGSGFYIKQNLADSIEGDLIYPLKDINENLILIPLEAEYGQRALDYIDFSQGRMKEIKKLVEQKRDKDKIISTLGKLSSMQKLVQPNIENAKQMGKYQTGITDNFRLALQEQSETLNQLSVLAEPALYQPILDAKFQTDNLLNTIR